jgi:threonine aldolase
VQAAELSDEQVAAEHARPLLAGDLWLRNARHANAMAGRLADGIAGVDGVEISHPVESNAVFARLPRRAIDRLLAGSPYERPFHVWREEANEVRLMCAWDTEPDEVDAFAGRVAQAVAG